MGNTKDTYTQEFRGTDASLGSTIDDLTKRMGKFAESENKVKKNLSGFVGDLAGARSGFDVLTSAVHRASEALKIGIVGGVVASTMLQIKENSDAVTKSFDDMREAMAGLEKGRNVNNVSKSLEQLNKESEEAAAAQSKLQKEINSFQDTDVWSGMIANRHFWGAAGGKLLETVSGGLIENQYKGVNEQMHNDLARMERIQADAEKEKIRREGVNKVSNSLKLQSATGPVDPYEEASIAQKTLELSKEELRLTEKAAVRDEEGIAKQKISVALQQQKVDEMNAELRVLDLRKEHRIDEQMMEARTGSESAVEKQVKLMKLTAELAQAEADAMKVKNTEQGRFLQLKADELKMQPGLLDEQLNKGKSSKEVRDRIRDQEKQQRESEKFRARREKDGGLIPTKRNMAGEVEEGIDPVTGEKVKRDLPSELDKRKARAAKKAGKGVEDFIGPIQPEAEKEKAAAKEEQKKDAKEANKELVQEVKGLRQDVKDLVNKR